MQNITLKLKVLKVTLAKIEEIEQLCGLTTWQKVSKECEASKRFEACVIMCEYMPWRTGKPV